MWYLQGHSLKDILATLVLLRVSEVISQEKKGSTTTVFTNLFNLLITELSSYNSFITAASRYYYAILVIDYAELKYVIPKLVLEYLRAQYLVLYFNFCSIF